MNKPNLAYKKENMVFINNNLEEYHVVKIIPSFVQNLLSALANLIASVSVFTASSAKSAAVQTHALSLPQFGCKLMSLVTET